jgi:transposase
LLVSKGKWIGLTFGHVMVGRAKRALSCFVMTLSYSRALYLEFFFDQTMENFLRGHVHAFAFFQGQPRVILYDNLKSAVRSGAATTSGFTRG